MFFPFLRCNFDANGAIMKITIEIENQEKADALVYFLQNHGYDIRIHTNDKLRDEDWVLPGRPATDEEHEDHAKAMEEEGKYEKGEDLESVFDRLFKKYKP